MNRIYIKQTNKNDCAITSLHIFENIPYHSAFDIFKNNYSAKKGTMNFAIFNYMQKYDCLCFHDTTSYFLQKRENKTTFLKGITLKTFVKKYNKGKYYVLIKNHAIVVDNGIILDSAATSDNVRIRCAWVKNS